MEATVKILGCRGSFPVSGQEFSEFGGSTTSFLLDLYGESLLVDAGSGILNLPEPYLQQKELSILLTHFHLDHLMGLLLFRYLLDPAHTLHLYASYLHYTSCTFSYRPVLKRGGKRTAKAFPGLFFCKRR